MDNVYVSRGPVATMPGSTHTLPEGTMCDDHPDRPAVVRMQGETDSFGCEYFMMCAECKAEHDKQAPVSMTGTCDWCKKPNLSLFNHRDWEEGMSGPVYTVCGGCRDKNLDSAHEEDRRSNPFVFEDDRADPSQIEYDDWDGDPVEDPDAP